MAERGYFVLADISGYTAFLNQAELEHAEDILRHLIGALLKNTAPPLVIAKLEGDAIFSYAPQGGFLQGQTLLESIEKMYVAFRETLERTRLNTTCTCRACTLIPSLDLKFVVHYGEYLVQQIGGLRDLQGMEVITVHRLLKNTVKEKTHCEAYTLFSAAAVNAAGMAEIATSMIPHLEEYEHVGEVPGFVYDMHPVWARQSELRRDKVEDAELWLSAGADLPIPPALAWDYITRPDIKRRWMDVPSLTLVNAQGGRQLAGSEQHCAHGDRLTIFQITDWRPFDYYTVQYELMKGVSSRETFRLTPCEGGTRFEIRDGRLVGRGLLSRLFASILQRILTRFFKTAAVSSTARLSQIVQQDLDSGSITIEPPDPSGLIGDYAPDQPLRLTPIQSGAHDMVKR